MKVRFFLTTLCCLLLTSICANEPIRKKVRVGDYSIMTYRYGHGKDTIVLVNGGPGCPCDYLRESHKHLAEKGYTVVAYDQLGNGESDHPTGQHLWTLEHYIDELEVVRQSLNIDKMHLLGHSWGTVLGIEYALKHPDQVQSLILADGTADIPHFTSELHRLRNALGPETVSMMQRHEAEGTIDHPEYEAAVTILNHRHCCRLDVFPDVFMKSFANINMEIYQTMQGPNEFTFTGNLKNWSRLDSLCHFKQPVLILVGRHDTITPACASLMHQNFPNSKLIVFKHSGHLPMFEEPQKYFLTLTKFLQNVAE